MRTVTLFGIVCVAASAAVAACSGTPDSSVVVAGWAQPPSAGGGGGGGGGGDGGVGGPGVDGGPGTGTDSGSQGSKDSGGSSGGEGGSASGVPCDVATMLASLCTGCHSDPPIPGALAGLVTYSDLMAKAQEDPTKNEAQLSLARMKDAAKPMPPGSLPPAADVTILQNWINAGYPMGSCGGDGGNEGGPPPPSSVFNGQPPYMSPGNCGHTHNAGQNCLTSGCHDGTGGGGARIADANQFAAAGTVYDSSGNAVVCAEVRLVDASGKGTSVYTGDTGTFHIDGTGFAAPAHVGTRNATAVQDMHTALQSTTQGPASTGGACSACHCTGTGCTITAVHLP